VISLLLCLPFALQDPAVAAREPLAAPAADMVLAMYDVRHLTFPEREEGVAGAFQRMREEGTVAEALRKEAAEKTLDNLLVVARAYMQPEWSGEANHVRSIRSEVVTLLASPAQHAWMRAFLEVQQQGEVMLDIRTQCVEGPRGAFLHPEGGASRVLENRKKIDAFLTPLRKSEQFELLQAPRMLCMPSQAAQIWVGNQTSYVKSWKVHVVEPGGQEIADPEIGVVHEGFDLNFRATPVPTSRPRFDPESDSYVVGPELAFAVELDFKWAEVQRPIATHKVRLSATNDTEVEVSTPEVTSVSLAASALLVDDSGLLVGAPSSSEDRDIAILISVKRFDVKDYEPKNGRGAERTEVERR